MIAVEPDPMDASGEAGGEEAFGVEDEDGLGAGLNHALSFPLGDDAADSERVGAGELGEFVAGEGDLDAGGGGLSDVAQQAEEGECDATLDAFGGYIEEAILKFAETFEEDVVDIVAELGDGGEEPFEGGLVPDEGFAAGHDACRGAVVVALEQDGDAEGVVCAAEVEDDLGTMRAMLGELDAAVVEEEEVVGGLILGEEELIGAVEASAGGFGGSDELVERKALEEGGGAKEVDSAGQGGAEGRRRVLGEAVGEDVFCRQVGPLLTAFALRPGEDARAKLENSRQWDKGAPGNGAGNQGQLTPALLTCRAGARQDRSV